MHTQILVPYWYYPSISSTVPKVIRESSGIGMSRDVPDFISCSSSRPIPCILCAYCVHTVCAYCIHTVCILCVLSVHTRLFYSLLVSSLLQSDVVDSAQFGCFRFGLNCIRLRSPSRWHGHSPLAMVADDHLFLSSPPPLLVILPPSPILPLWCIPLAASPAMYCTVLLAYTQVQYSRCS